MKIKAYFESLSFIQKVELYLIVIMVYFLVITFYADILKLVYTSSSDSYRIDNNQIDLSKPKNYISSKNVDLLNYLNSMAKRKDIELLESRNLSNKIEILAIGEYKHIISFVSVLQEQFVVNSFSLSNENNIISLEISLKTNYFINSNQVKEEDTFMSNPFLRANTKVIGKKVSSKDIPIKAIFSSEILVNGKWYKVGDEIAHNKIISIGIDSVELENLTTHLKRIRKVHYE